MAKNIQDDKLENSVLTKLNKLSKQFEELRSNQLNVLIIPVVSADPSPLTNGQIWYRSDTNVFKCYQNGAVKTFTVS